MALALVGAGNACFVYPAQNRTIHTSGLQGLHPGTLNTEGFHVQSPSWLQNPPQNWLQKLASYSRWEPHAVVDITLAGSRRELLAGLALHTYKHQSLLHMSCPRPFMMLSSEPASFAV